MRGRSSEGMRWVRGLVLGLGALACASATTETAGTARVLRDVQVARDGDATVVTLVGVEDPVYTAYLQQDPQRLTVDLDEMGKTANLASGFDYPSPDRS